MADSTPKSYHTDPTLYLYTSLTAGSSHIITATSRLETILKANRIPFQALDVATDEKARMLWGRRAGKRKLPGLVRLGMLVGDLEEIEEWNEYGELKDKVGVRPMPSTPSAANTPSKAPPSTPPSNTPSKLLSPVETPSRPTSSSNTESPMATAMRQAGAEAAKKAGDAKARALAKAKGASSTTTGTLQKSGSLIDTGSSAGGMDVASTKAPVTVATKPASTLAATGDGPTDITEKETYEGEGSKDPDEEAVVTGSKDTIDVDDNATSSNQNVESSAPNVGATTGPNNNNKGENDAAPETNPPIASDPDAEAVVPESNNNTAGPEKEVQAIHDNHRKNSEDEDGDAKPGAKGRSTVDNTTKATSATDNTESLSGKRTQEQASAKADEAGISVAD